MQRRGLSNGAKRNLGLDVVGFLLRFWADRTAGVTRKRRMQLLETLPLGGKSQMMLVRCDDEEFLVCGGINGIEAIVKIGLSVKAAEVCE